MSELHTEMAGVMAEVFEGPAAERCTVGAVECMGIFGTITPISEITPTGFNDGVSTSLSVLRSDFGTVPIRCERVERHETNQSYDIESVITDDPVTITLVLGRTQMRVYQ